MFEAATLPYRELSTTASAVDPDGDVLALAARGDPRLAIDRLMQRHGTAVYRYCSAALHDPTLADDVNQQVFLAAYHDLASFAGRSTVRVWLFAIARHRVLDAAKRRRRAEAHVDELDGVESIDPRPSPAEAIDDDRLRAALIAGLGELGAEARCAVLLRYQQGFSFEEMSALCGQRAGTLQARVARARQQLRAYIVAHTRDPR